MSANKSASLEARLKNNKDLVTSLKQLSKYSPTSEDIKSDKYDEFIEQVETQMIPYKNSNAELTTAKSNNVSVISSMTDISRSIRSEIAEIKGEQSAEYTNVNSIVKMITGQNISEHTSNVRKARKGLKEGETLPESISVAQLDFKSRLGNFKSLISLLRTYDFYEPSEVQLSIEALEAKAAEVSASLLKLGEKDSKLTNERSRVIDLFDKKGGLSDRSKRARLHVKRKYGLRSPEYKSLVNKKY